MPIKRAEIVLDEFLRGQDGAAEAAALAVDVLGRRIDDDVGAERQRLLQERRRKDIVDHKEAAGLVGEVGHRLEIDEFQRRVRRRLEKYGLDRPRQRAAPGIEIAAVDHLRLDAVAWQYLLNDVET